MIKTRPHSAAMTVIFALSLALSACAPEPEDAATVAAIPEIRAGDVNPGGPRSRLVSENRMWNGCLAAITAQTGLKVNRGDLKIAQQEGKRTPATTRRSNGKTRRVAARNELRLLRLVIPEGFTATNPQPASIMRCWSENGRVRGKIEQP